MQKAVLIKEAAGLVPRTIENQQRILDVCGTMPMLFSYETLKVFRVWTRPHQQSVWLRHN